VKDYTEAVEQKEARYSAKVIEESSNPSNMGPMSEPDAHGIIHGCCGDTMEIYLRLDGDRIEEATFTTDGRESAIACASSNSRFGWLTYLPGSYNDVFLSNWAMIRPVSPGPTESGASGKVMTGIAAVQVC
jgi:hypothetical protein